MSATTGPVLAAGALVVFNAVIVQRKPPIDQRRVVVGALIAAAGLSLWERAMPRTAVAVAWLTLTATILVRVDPATPSPLESLQQWLKE